MEYVLTRVNRDNTDYWTHDMWLDRGRERWNANGGRIFNCPLLFVLDKTNTVRAAGQIEGVTKNLDGGNGRVSIIARPLPDNEWIGKRVDRPGSRNPVVYVRGLTEVID